MTLFRNETSRGVWIEHHCARCYRDANLCTILQKALRTQRKPVEWDRNPRATLMQEAYKCNEFSRTPPRIKGDKQFEDVPMFDVEPQDKTMVPVEGWPDPLPPKGVDHA